MNLPRSEREKHLDAWSKFLTAVEKDDRVTVQRMRGQFTDQQLGTELVDAARFNSVEVVAELLNNASDGIMMYVHDAVMRSAEKGHAEVLRMVMQHADPKRIGCYNLALWGALVHNHPQCVEMLFDWVEVDEVLRISHERGAKPNVAWEAFEQRVAERQRAVLTDTIEPRGQARGTRKI